MMVKKYFFFLKIHVTSIFKFHAENLGSLTPATTRKLFTLAKFYRVTEHRDSFNVLKNWIQIGDGSHLAEVTWNLRKLGNYLSRVE
jgi:hypothetical protein